MSVVCGIELKSSHAHIVTLSGTKGNFTEVLPDVKKISIHDPKSQDEIKSFRNTIQQFFINAKVEKVGLNGRSTSGEHAGGVVSFKLEALIQSCDVPVELVYPASYTATLRKHPLDKFAKYKYLETAHKISYHLLDE